MRLVRMPDYCLTVHRSNLHGVKSGNLPGDVDGV
jgi:hypothetical protein